MAGMPAAWEEYSTAASVASSGESCWLPTKGYEGTTDIDSMLQSLEATLKQPSSHVAGLLTDHS